jgi:NAD(P)-dependent dehydrogenase (short-subunit alcohol dehydrogenase family)
VQKKVLITGGTGALGEAVTQRFLDDGWKVAGTWIVERDGRALEARASEHLTPVRCDVTHEESVATVVKRVREDGPIHALVHLVGAWKGGTDVKDLPLEEWQRLHDINLKSAFLCARAVLPGMLEQDFGRIVMVSARTARMERSGQSAYAVAKAGVAVLAETIAEETRGTNVTANVVAPSALDTPGNRKAMPNADPSRWVPLDDMAATIAFLCSEEAGQMRGGWLPVYGAA